MATILLVDDKELNRSMMSSLLGYQGHRIVEANDGVEALRKVRTENPELVITDILMPNMDGYELVKRLRATDATRNVKILFYSALYREKETRTLAAACGVARIISKPTDPQEILKVVEEVLGSDGGSPSFRMGSRDVVNMLSEKLYEKVVELEELNRTLENRIALRTIELEDSNRRLQLEIGEREKAEKEAASDRESKLKMKSAFLSHVSHELRSPLTVVHQFVSILLDGLGGPINASQKDYLQIALRNVNQLKGLIDDLLEASRAEESKLILRPSVIAASEVLNQTIHDFDATAASKGIKIRFDMEGSLPSVYADPARTSQVLVNLLDNAIKFSPAESTIEVRARILGENPDLVCVSVADHGCGVAPEDCDRIFERLYQVKHSVEAPSKGLGLGLYICKEIIQLQGGTIWNDKTRHGGCTISFTLPVFSIRRIIAPVVKHGNLVDASFALIIIEVLPFQTWASERRRQQIVSELYHVVERCVIPDLDILLPPQSRAELDLFWVFARIDKSSSDILLTRIRTQISESQSLLAGMYCQVSIQFLDTSGMDPGWPLENQIQHIVASLEDLLHAGIPERKEML